HRRRRRTNWEDSYHRRHCTPKGVRTSHPSETYKHATPIGVKKKALTLKEKKLRVVPKVFEWSGVPQRYREFGWQVPLSFRLVSVLDHSSLHATTTVPAQGPLLADY